VGVIHNDHTVIAGITEQDVRPFADELELDVDLSEQINQLDKL
jgi:hypothetical protein